ncbi:MAG TPA: hypothetical protein VLG44_06805 [Chlamydiales bacterium]|nr:hypothetical protein [Chlamydiales bacterium]
MATKAVTSPAAIPFPANWHILALSPQRELVDLFTSYLNVKDTIAFLSCCGTLWDIRSPRFFKNLDFTGTRPDLEKFTEFAVNCVNTVMIDLSRCKSVVTDAWFEKIGAHCGNLRRINLNNPTIDLRDRTTDDGLKHFVKCQKLQEIIGVALYSIKPICDLVAQCPKLTRFNTVYWRADDELPKAVAKCPKFTKLELGCCDITDKGVAQLKNLQTLRLAIANGVTRSGIQTLMQNNPGVQELELWNSPVEDQHLFGCRELRDLRLVGCEKITLTGIIFVLSKNPKIEVLDLSIDINDEWLRQMAPHCPSLKMLMIPEDLVSDMACREFFVQKPNTVLKFSTYSMKSEQMRAHEEEAATLHRTVSDVNRCLRTATIAGKITKDRLDPPFVWQMRLKAVRAKKTVLRPLLLHPDCWAYSKNAPTLKKQRTEKE